MIVEPPEASSSAPQPGEEEEGDLKVTFACDYLGRRVDKKVSTWDDVGQE